MGVKAKWQHVLIFVLVPILPILIFWLLPTFIAFWLSFTDWDYISPNFDYVWFENYVDLLTSSQFLDALMQTFTFAFLTVVPTLILSFIIALSLSKLAKTSSLLRNLIFSPYVTPTVAMSIVFSWLFNPNVGPVSKIFLFFGQEAPTWSTQQPWATLLITIVTLWQTVGYSSIFYADAISRIPKDLFEVADIEGLTNWQRLKHIYIPMVVPTTILLTVMQTITALQAYEQIDVLTQGGPSGSTRTLLYLYYELGFERFDMGEATALAMVLLVISLLLSYAIVRINRRVV